jgi:hypothetical protein
MSGKISMCFTKKNRVLFDTLISMFSGRVEPILNKNGIQYSVKEKEEVFSIVNNYFSKYTLMSSKRHILSSISCYFIYGNKQHNSLSYVTLGKYFKWFDFRDT